MYHKRIRSDSEEPLLRGQQSVYYQSNGDRIFKGSDDVVFDDKGYTLKRANADDLYYVSF